MIASYLIFPNLHLLFYIYSLTRAEKYQRIRLASSVTIPAIRLAQIYSCITGVWWSARVIRGDFEVEFPLYAQGRLCFFFFFFLGGFVSSPFFSKASFLRPVGGPTRLKGEEETEEEIFCRKKFPGGGLRASRPPDRSWNRKSEIDRNHTNGGGSAARGKEPPWICIIVDRHIISLCRIIIKMTLILLKRAVCLANTGTSLQQLRYRPVTRNGHFKRFIVHYHRRVINVGRIDEINLALWSRD